MRKIVIIFYLSFISVVARSQASWETRFVIEFWRDDTTEFLITDSLKIGTVEQAQENNVSMYMNKNSLLIYTPNPISNAQIEIMDITGKIVSHKSNLSIETTVEIPIDELARGVYFATIYTGQSYLIRKLFKP